MSLTTLLQGINPFLPEETISTPVDVVSSNIQSIGYDPKKALLRVAFRSGGLYDYSDVPYSKYKKMLNADSKGKFFHSQLRGKYDMSKIAKERNLFRQHAQASGISPKTFYGLNDREYNGQPDITDVMLVKPTMQFDAHFRNARKSSNKDLRKRLLKMGPEAGRTMKGVAYAAEYKGRGLSLKNVSPDFASSDLHAKTMAETIRLDDDVFQKKVRMPVFLGSIGSILFGVGSGAIGEQLGNKHNVAPEAFDKFIDHAKSSIPSAGNVDISMSQHIPSHFNPAANSIVSAPNKSVLLHEMGHSSNANLYERLLGKNSKKISDALYHDANDLSRGAAGRFIGTLANVPIAPLVLAAPLLSQRLTQRIKRNRDESSKIYRAADAVERNPEKVLGAAFIPKLLEEGSASGRALFNLAKLSPKGTKMKEVMRGASTLGPAFGTYLAPAGMAVALGYGIKKKRELDRKRVKKLINQ